jgi:leucine dehydrogenase
VYVPDYAANAGGLINVVAELEEDGYNKARVIEKCRNIEQIVLSILEESKKKNVAPNIVADDIARRVMESLKYENKEIPTPKL